MKNLYCFIGPSGVGKDAIVSGLERQYGYKQLKSYTTRPKRNDDDIGHIFISKEEFGKMSDDVFFNDFKGFAAYSYFDGNYYFATIDQIQDNDLYIVDQKGFDELKKKELPKKLKLFYLCASEMTRNRRMIHRGDSIEQVRQRIEYDKKMFDHGRLSKEADKIFLNERRSIEEGITFFHQCIENYERGD